ncbi:RING-H2 finger protein ATL56 [Euphorbia peplus]|nr:RING-H2 finger protein ATL56 [Euphorbia peplus]
MPSHDSRRDLRSHGGAPKSNQKFLSIILRVIIMTAITTLFFVFLGVAAILLLAATAALHRHSGPSKSSNGLSLKELKKLPQFRFSRKKKGELEADCPVCLDGMKQGQWCRKLSGCGHVFHRKCVDTWLVKVSGCPTCRTKVRLDDDEGTARIEGRTFWGFD